MRAALGVLAVLMLALAGCSSSPSQGSPPQAAVNSHQATASPVRCGLLTCSHGRVGLPCTIAGYPGIIVQVSARALGCDPKPGKLPTAAVPPAAPSPVSTAAALNGNCVMGYEWTPDSTNAASGRFVPGPPRPGNGHGDPALAYQITLTSTSGSTADVTGFAVVFYDASGSEAGSDQESASGFITPGQSLSWTVIEDRTVRGYGDDPNQQLTQTGAIPANAATCRFLQWYHS